MTVQTSCKGSGKLSITQVNGVNCNPIKVYGLAS